MRHSRYFSAFWDPFLTGLGLAGGIATAVIGALLLLNFFVERGWV